jgi:hypothetical protein
MRRVIGRASGQDEQMLGILDAWQRSGAQRLDGDGDNVYDHSAAVALMDAWWPRAVTAEFQPTLGKRLLDQILNNVLSLKGDFGWDWSSQVQKDLRNVLGKREPGRYSRVYCGGALKRGNAKKARRASRARCRAVLLSTLHAATAEVAAQQGTPDPSRWKVLATCKKTKPPSCDQEVPNTAGAIDTPPFPWQNRGTYHQIDEIAAHR